MFGAISFAAEAKYNFSSPGALLAGVAYAALTVKLYGVLVRLVLRGSALYLTLFVAMVKLLAAVSAVLLLADKSPQVLGSALAGFFSLIPAAFVVLRGR